MAKSLSLSKTMPKDDERQKKWKKQRKERGFDDTELWSLDCTIISFILPRLKTFRKKLCSHPAYITMEAWDEILDKIINGFELYNIGFPDDEQALQIEVALDLFRKYFHHLWT